MTESPEKFLYVYVKDHDTNPKLVFDIHHGPLPEKNRRSYAQINFQSLTQEKALEDYDALDKVGFIVLVTVLQQLSLKKGKNYSVFVYPSDERTSAFYVDDQLYREHEGGDFFTFIPLKPIPEDLDTTGHIHDDILCMRVGQVCVRALLD